MAKKDKTAVRVEGVAQNGQPTVMYVDPDSGEQIENLSGYSVVDGNEYSDTEGVDYQTLAQEALSGKSSQRNTGLVQNPLLHESENRGGTNEYLNPANAPSASNNFRYVDKPSGVLGLMSRMPGQIGLAGKAVGAMMGVQNTHATGKAREFLGLEPNYLSNGLKNVLGDPEGYVGDVKIGDVDYSISLGSAVDKDGRTTLTPQEARQRSLTTGQPLTEATRAEKKASIAQAKAEAKAGGYEKKGVLGTLADNVFGGVSKSTQAAREISRAVQNAPTRNSSYDIAVGMGMGDLPARQMAGISYDLSGKGRSEIPSQGPEYKVADVVTDVLGPGYTVNVTSGMEPEGHAPVGSKDRHPNGVAVDMDIRDPEGRSLSLDNPADRQAIQDVQQGFAARYQGNIGMGPEYMGNKTMHMDTLDLSQHPGLGAQWGSVGKQMAGTFDYAREYGLMPASYYDQVVDKAPAPTERPDPEAIAEVTEPDATRGHELGYGLASTQSDSLMGANTPASNPDRFANLSQEERSLMAQTLAGEIDTTKTDLSTEEGQKEAMGILSTIENRVGKYGSITDAIQAPNQYSTWGTTAAANTAMKNYNLNPNVYNGLVDGFVSDPSKNLGYTSYHANTVNPGWSSAMADRTTIGAHTFGSLPEYQSKTNTQSVGMGALDMVQGQTAFNTSATSAPSANSGIDLGVMNQMDSQKSNTPDTTSKNDTSSSSSMNSSSSNSDKGDGGSDSGGHGGSNSGPAANSSGSPDDRDER